LIDEGGEGDAVEEVVEDGVGGHAASPLSKLRACWIAWVGAAYFRRRRMKARTLRGLMPRSACGVRLCHAAISMRAVSRVVQSIRVIYLRPGVKAMTERQPWARGARSPWL